MPHPIYYSNKSDPATIFELFNRAEHAIKKIERIERTFVIPAVNQLRYAGCHLTRYLLKEDKDELRMAANHCIRAMYDSYETGIYFFLEKFDRFRDDYESIIIADIMPEWISYCEKVQEVEDFFIQKVNVDLDENPKEHNPEDTDSDDDYRIKYLEKCQDYFDNLNAIVKRLDHAWP